MGQRFQRGCGLITLLCFQKWPRGWGAAAQLTPPPPHPGESGFSRIREHAEPGPHSPRAPGLWPQRCTPSAIPPSSGPVHWTLTQTPPSLSCPQPPPTYSSSEFPHIWSSPRWPQTLYLARSEHVSLRVCVHIHHAFTRAHAHTIGSGLHTIQPFTSGNLVFPGSQSLSLCLSAPTPRPRHVLLYT